MFARCFYYYYSREQCSTGDGDPEMEFQEQRYPATHTMWTRKLLRYYALGGATSRMLFCGKYTNPKRKTFINKPSMKERNGDLRH